MKVLDLFSGIGGFSLGLERAGMTTVAFVEREPYCRAVLRKHWPTVPVFEDVLDVDATRLAECGIAADVICGGFPCQPFSSASAGRRRGTQDDRFLWPEMLRIVSEVRPAWVCAENVTHIDGLALEQVVSDLGNEGYTVETLEIPACAVGHDHWRARLWILGYANRHGQPIRPVYAEMAGVSWSSGDARGVGATHGLSGRMDRLRALGNAVVPQIPEMIGRAIIQAGTR